MAAKSKCDPEKLRALYANRDDDFWAWRDAVEQVGIDATLDALGYSKERSALWYNEHTGDVETLESLILDVDYFGSNETEEAQVFEFAMALENWLPQLDAPNPVMARSLAMTEHDAMQQVADDLRDYAMRNETADAFIADVHTMGGTLPDGDFDVKAGKVKVDLHDGREFVFSLRAIFDDIRTRETQLALAI